MKDFLRKIFFGLGSIFFSPLLIPFLITTEKEIIIADIRAWEQGLGWQEMANFRQLIQLCQKVQEFRNLYYYRLFQGNLGGKIFLPLCKLFYPPCSSLFLDNSSKIGGGLFLQHGFSTIIMADMGENCWVNQQVTIGYKDETGRPTLGNHVRVTAGAKILGKITIGDHVTVGANAVVLKNVPDNCVVVGIPAYIVKRDGVKVKEKLL